eukprot:333857_1
MGNRLSDILKKKAIVTQKQDKEDASSIETIDDEPQTVNKTIKFVHAAQEDSDRVYCTSNEWINMIDKERRRLQSIKLNAHARQSNGVVSIDNNFQNVTMKEAEQSFTQQDKQTYDKTCGQKFIKSTANESNATVSPRSLITSRSSRFGYIQCSSCYTGFMCPQQQDSVIFMCPQHMDYILCPLCLGYHSEMNIYAKIKKKHINNENQILQKQYELEFNSSIERVQKNKIYNLNKICQNYAGHISIEFEKNVYDIIIEYIGKRDMIKIIDSKLLLDLFDSCWNFQSIREKKESKSGEYDMRYIVDTFLSFHLQKLDINVSEFEKIQNDAMYKKFVKHNTKEINWEEFKSEELVSALFKIKKIKKEIVNDNNCLLLGDILNVLCQNEKYSFYGLVMAIETYSYAGHPYYPGGPPQISGRGESILFKITSKKVIQLFFCGYLRSVQRNKLMITIPMDIRDVLMRFIDVNTIYDTIKVLNTIYVVSTFQVMAVGV